MSRIVMEARRVRRRDRRILQNFREVFERPGVPLRIPRNLLRNPEAPAVRDVAEDDDPEPDFDHEPDMDAASDQSARSGMDVDIPGHDDVGDDDPTDDDVGDDVSDDDPTDDDVGDDVSDDDPTDDDVGDGDGDDGDHGNDDDGGDDDDDALENLGAPFFLHNHLGLNVPLQSDPDVTAKDHLLVVMAMAIRHRWSYEAMMDVLRWISRSHLRNRLPETKDGLWRLLSRNPESVKKHYYCRKCRAHLGEEVNQPCACLACGPGEPDTHLGYFLELGMASQLTQLFSIPSVSKHLNYRFDRQKRDVNALEDIYDGVEYRRLCLEGNFLHNPNNFSITFNTDGCKVSNSSHTSAWPIYAQINELPPHMRKKHMILAGIYVGGQHPLLNNYLRPFVSVARQLYEEGIEWQRTPNLRVTSKFVVVIGCVDSPARASLMRMVQFNGRYGCLHCLAVGRSLGPGKFVYPCELAFGTPRRDHEGVVSDMNEAYRDRTTVRGFKGISCVIGLPELDVCAGVVVDSMHAIFLGVVKQHTRLLLESVIAPYYIGAPNSIRLIDSRLLSIKPPSRRSRTPRTLNSWKNWKASEFRNWLGYAPACLEGVIDVKYIHHIALLAEAVHILNCESITPDELDRADALIGTYVRLFQEFFGVANMSFNLHILTHITTCVRNWGPIWTHSAFVFESWNKKIIDRITSPHARTDQIATRFLMQKFTATAVHAQQMSPAARTIVVRILGITENGEDAAVILAEGRYVERPPTIEERRLLANEGLAPLILRRYRSLRCRGIRYRTDDARIGKKCDSIVFVDNRYYGVVTDVVAFHVEGDERFALFVKPFRRVSEAFHTRHVLKVVQAVRTRCVTNIESVRPAIRIVTESDYDYVYPISNCWETD